MLGNARCPGTGMKFTIFGAMYDRAGSSGNRVLHRQMRIFSLLRKTLLDAGLKMISKSTQITEGEDFSDERMIVVIRKWIYFEFHRKKNYRLQKMQFCGFQSTEATYDVLKFE